MDNPPIKQLIGIVPKQISTQMVLEALRYDPEQKREGLFPLFLQHPRTGKTKVLSEYVNDLLGDSRFAVETTTHLIYVSRVYRNPITKTDPVFIPTATLNKSTEKLLLLKR